VKLSSHGFPNKSSHALIPSSALLTNKLHAMVQIGGGATALRLEDSLLVDLPSIATCVNTNRDWPLRSQRRCESILVLVWDAAPMVNLLLSRNEEHIPKAIPNTGPKDPQLMSKDV